MTEQEVVLVNEKDIEVGRAGKLLAHQNGGKLHRAISIFVFNKKGETMLQKRALTKYHAAGQWANTVCSHPYPGESVSDAAHRRLKEEMGFDCDIREVFQFTYKAAVGKGLTEHEYDHILFGSYEKTPVPNPEEVSDWRWVSLEALKKDIAKDPEQYVPWLKLMLNRIVEARERA